METDCGKDPPPAKLLLLLLLLLSIEKERWSTAPGEDKPWAGIASAALRMPQMCSWLSFRWKEDTSALPKGCQGHKECKKGVSRGHAGSEKTKQQQQNQILRVHDRVGERHGGDGARGGLDVPQLERCSSSPRE